MFSFIFTATQTAGALGGIGWITEKIAKYSAMLYRRVMRNEKMQQFASRTKAKIKEALPTKGSGTESGVSEGGKQLSVSKILDQIAGLSPQQQPNLVNRLPEAMLPEA
jgi:hypothetical protein